MDKEKPRVMTVRGKNTFGRKVPRRRCEKVQGGGEARRGNGKESLQKSAARKKKGKRIHFALLLEATHCSLKTRSLQRTTRHRGLSSFHVSVFVHHYAKDEPLRDVPLCFTVACVCVRRFAGVWGG